MILSGLSDEALSEGELGQTNARCFAGLSQEEKKVWVEIISSRTLSNPMIDEMHRSDENFEAEMTMRFPETVPVLYILAEDTCNTMENWKSMHEDLTADNPASKIVVLQGNHYIHHCDPEGVVSLTEEWMTR